MINYKSYFFVYNLEPIPKIDRHIVENVCSKCGLPQNQVSSNCQENTR